MTYQPPPIPRSHLYYLDCVQCGAPTLAVMSAADQARCTTCWNTHIDALMAARRAARDPHATAGSSPDATHSDARSDHPGSASDPAADTC